MTRRWSAATPAHPIAPASFALRASLRGTELWQRLLAESSFAKSVSRDARLSCTIFMVYMQALVCRCGFARWPLLDRQFRCAGRFCGEQFRSVMRVRFGGKFRYLRDIDREFSVRCRYAEPFLLRQTTRNVARHLEISGEPECRLTLLIRPR